MIDEPVPTMPLMVPATSPTARTKRKFKGLVSANRPLLIPGMSAIALIPKERRLRRVSKDEGCTLASWFETAQERLLTMRQRQIIADTTLAAGFD
jgi:hypothetical protein